MDPVPPPLSANPSPATAASGEMSDRDTSQLQLLAIFHFVLAGFTFLIGCLPVIYLVLGLIMLTNPAFLQQMGPTDMESYRTHEEMQEDVLFGDETPPREVPNIEAEAVPAPSLPDADEDEEFKVIGGVMIGIAAIMILLAWTAATLMVIAGRSLQKRKRHLFCLVVAGLSCLFVPLGTVLGILTIVVLQRPAITDAFNQR